MPAVFDDPASPSLPAPQPTTTLPTPTTYTLRDGTLATLYPITTPSALPTSLLAFLALQLNAEIERGDTYPHDQALTQEAFGEFWFGTFGAVLILGDVVEGGAGGMAGEAGEADVDWAKLCLGTFSLKSNYPGRCSHVCNGAFLTTVSARGKGCGTVMGGAYVQWAKMLGYTYSVFNLVFETNTASLRTWEKLGFEQIGRVKGAARLKSFPGRLVDALIIGREL